MLRTERQTLGNVKPRYRRTGKQSGDLKIKDTF